MYTVDRATIDSTGAFIVGELERMDQTLNMPLVSVKWTRDMPLRSDISIADEVSSFTNTDFSSVGGPNPIGKNWMGKKGTATPGPELDILPTRNNLTPWATEVSWTVLELASAQKLGRPIDTQKYEAMKLKWNMDIPFSGVVTVDRSLEAKRMAAGQNINGAILIVTQFRLTQGMPASDSTPELDADVVTYSGRNYRVTFVDPYTRYGAGFVQAHCELLEFNGGIPVE